MYNAGAPSSSPDVLERVLRELLDEEEERGMEERLAIVFVTGSLREFSGSTFQQDFTDFVRIMYDGEESGTYEFLRRRERDHVHALSLAAQLGLTRLCQALIQSFQYNVDAPCFQDGTGALHLATWKNRIPTVRTLIDLGANVNKTGNNQFTPLHIAVSRGHEELVRLLISRGANTETSCDFGTPLQCTAVASQQGTMQILLDNNVNVDSVSSNCSLTPLHLAVEHNSMECLQLLLGAKADARIGACGTTPLCHAATHGTFEMVGCLLTGGADPNAVDLFNSTPLENAISAGKLLSAEMLHGITATFTTRKFTGVIDHYSLDYIRERNRRNEEVFENTKGLGDEALQNGKYFNAVHWYTAAIYANPNDLSVYSNRSLSYSYLLMGKNALRDAQHCIRLARSLAGTSGDAQQRATLTRYLADAYYSKATAWNVLNDSRKALRALNVALELAPTAVHIQSAVRAFTVDTFLHEDRRG